VTCATCGAPERSKRRAPVKPAPKTSSFPSGLFSVTAARVVSDSCNGRVRFETNELEIDVVGGVVQSAPDNRPYEAVLDRGALVARYAFNRNSICQTYRQLEIWRLERLGDDEVSGYRTTYFRDSRHGDCLQACKVVYAIEAVRVDEDEEGELKCPGDDPLCGI
jgi:hypothetical protein